MRPFSIAADSLLPRNRVQRRSVGDRGFLVMRRGLGDTGALQATSARHRRASVYAFASRYGGARHRNVPQAGFGKIPRQMSLAAGLVCALLTASSLARAGDPEDCEHSANWASVVRACSAVIAQNPGSRALAWAYNRRGLAQDELDHTELALKDYSAAISADGDYIEAYLNRGVLLTHDASFAYIRYLRGESRAYYQLAEADFSRALEIDWRNVRAYYERGKMHLRKAHGDPQETEELDKAIADLTRALDLDPRYERVYAQRGLANDLRRNHDDAIADYAHAIEANPRDALMYEFQGRVLLERASDRGLSEDYLNGGPGRAKIARDIKADLDQAIADFDHAVALDPKSVEAIKDDRGRAVRMRNQ